MPRMRRFSRIVVGLLLSVLVTGILYPGAAAETPSCPGCGMVWKDTCLPFEQNNESAYNDEMTAALFPVAANLTPVPDYSNLSWSTAFYSLHNLMRERYAFTDWRDVDWDALYAQYSPQIAAAEKTGDKAAYYRALRGFLYSIHDGHVLIGAPEDYGARYADVGGGFGIAVSRLDTGRTIVSYVANGSAAEKAGLAFGDEVTAWNGKPVGDAINETSLLWAVRKPSTAEGILLQQQRFLTRAPVGTVATVTITNGTTSGSRTINLAAYDDQYDTLTRTTTFLQKQVDDVGVAHGSRDILAQISNDTVTTRTLPGGYTYLAVYGETYAVYQPFKAAVQAASANNSPGIILDLRFNNGGDDNLASCMAGWFVDTPVFYEYGTKYDPGLKKFVTVWEARTAPRPDRYTGPVAVLVSPYTISSGEGVPRVFEQSGYGTIIGYYGTNGAFGMETTGAYMPLNMTVMFPDGASLDQNGKIQVDSNATLNGGVAPKLRVPLTEENLARSMAGEDVQLAYALGWLKEQNGSPGSAAGSTVRPASTAAPVPASLPLLALGLILLFAIRKKNN